MTLLTRPTKVGDESLIWIGYMSALEIDVFWSFRSPWSFLATPRLRQWQERYELDVLFRPVYPIAIRTPEFFL
jgi:hypothetical protein